MRDAPIEMDLTIYAHAITMIMIAFSSIPRRHVSFFIYHDFSRFLMMRAPLSIDDPDVAVTPHFHDIIFTILLRATPPRRRRAAIDARAARTATTTPRARRAAAATIFIAAATETTPQ